MRYPIYDGKETCERCHKPIERDKAIWFELNSYTGRYEIEGTVPASETQGCFAFGPDCAKAVRKNTKTWKHIGLAKKNGACVA